MDTQTYKRWLTYNRLKNHTQVGYANNKRVDNRPNLFLIVLYRVIQFICEYLGHPVWEKGLET